MALFMHALAAQVAHDSQGNLPTFADVVLMVNCQRVLFMLAVVVFGYSFWWEMNFP